MAVENVLDAVERLEAVVQKFERILHGDRDARHEGLVDVVASLNLEVRKLRDEFQFVKRRRHHLWLWLVGYVCFLVSGMFAILAIGGVSSSPELYWMLDVPVALALFLALFFAGVSLLAFVNGFGWLDGGGA